MNAPIECLHAEQMHTIAQTLMEVSGAVTAQRAYIMSTELASVGLQVGQVLSVQNLGLCNFDTLPISLHSKITGN